MSLRRQLARRAMNSLDRPGLRWILAAAHSAAGRVLRHGPSSVRYDDGWVHRVGQQYLVELRPRRRVPELGEARVRDFWCYLYRPQPGDTVIDVGAGYGWETLYFAREVGESGRVVAIEAHPTVARCLERSLELSDLDQVTPINCAVGDRRETLFIDDDLSRPAANAISRSGDSKNIAVEARTLDEICDELDVGAVDFLKINIEGAERLAVRGMIKMIQRTRVVAVSCHDFRFRKTGNEFFQTKSLIEAWLKEQGFVTVPRQSKLPWIEDQVNAFNPALVTPDQLMRGHQQPNLAGAF